MKKEHSVIFDDLKHQSRNESYIFYKFMPENLKLYTRPYELNKKTKKSLVERFFHSKSLSEPDTEMPNQNDVKNI